MSKRRRVNFRVSSFYTTFSNPTGPIAIVAEYVPFELSFTLSNKLNYIKKVASKIQYIRMLERLSSITNISNDKLIELSQNAFIAGSTIVYSMFDDINPTYVQGIDIFTTTPSPNVLTILSQNNFNLNIASSSHESSEINIKINLQICRSPSTPGSVSKYAAVFVTSLDIVDVIMMFPYSYQHVYFHKGVFVANEHSVKSMRTRSTFVVDTEPSKLLHNKAILLGFDITHSAAKLKQIYNNRSKYSNMKKCWNIINADRARYIRFYCRKRRQLPAYMR